MSSSIHTFDIIVPNISNNSVQATLRIAEIDPYQIAGLTLDGKEQLEVSAFGLSEDRCRKVAVDDRKLSITLSKYTDTVIRAVIETVNPAAGVAAAAAFNVTDERNGALAGGVTIVCTTPPYPNDLPPAPDPDDPCPLALGAALRFVAPSDDPSGQDIYPAGSLTPTQPRDLVARVRNEGQKDIQDTLLYLEHAGAGLSITPKVWHLGTIEPGGEFWATWTVDAAQAEPGEYEAVFVAQSAGESPTRLRGSYKVLPRNW
jgi:hypothetical protein